MKILFDNSTPNPIARSLTGHQVAFARRIGWHELSNGELIRKAEEGGYDMLVTTDKNIVYQQIFRAVPSPSSCWATSNGRTSACIWSGSRQP